MYRDVPEVRKRLLEDLDCKDDEELFEYLGIDFRWVSPAYVGPPLKNEVSGTIKNIFGVEYSYKRNASGGYWEPTTFPLQNEHTVDILKTYPWPKLEWFDFSVLDEQLERYKDYAIMTAPNMYCSPGILSTIQDLFGMEKALTDMYLNPGFWHETAKHIMEFNRAFLTTLFDTAKGRIDFFRIGDDYGTQRGLLFSPQHFDEFIAPCNAEMVRIAKEHKAYYYHHSCGSIYEMIPKLIELGVDVLDPMQIKAAHMDAETLKRTFGNILCFSGGVDEQELLPYGTKEDVQVHVESLLEIMTPGGGFIIGPTHNFQEDISTENILTLYETARSW